jgi:YihY family inner membrane protein
MRFFSDFKKDIRNIITAPTEELGRWGRYLAFQLKVWPTCVRLLKETKAAQLAAALSYNTIFAVVPLMIVVFLVFQMFPASEDVGQQVRQLIYEQAQLDDIMITSGSGAEEETVKLTDVIDDLASGFISKLNKGAVAFFNGVIIFFAAIALLITIEKAFNSIWHIPRQRPFINRIVNYWSLLTLGPLLLALGLYVSAKYFSIGDQIEGLGYVRALISYFISVVLLFSLYFLIPNTSVNPKAALWGALVAAFIWTGAKQLLTIYVTVVIPKSYISQVYGIMGLVPLGVLWIFVTWLIVLFGVVLTFATQHLQSLTKKELNAMKRREEFFMVNDFAVIRILRFVLGEFEQKRAPVSAQVVNSKLNLPGEFGEKILEHLVNQNLLIKTSDPGVGYVPATDGDNITLSEVVEASIKGSFVQRDEDRPGPLKAIMDKYQSELSRHTLKEILSDTERSLAVHKLENEGDFAEEEIKGED